MASRPRVACVTGRFQPLHHGHLELLGKALASGADLVIGVTNPDPSTRAAVRSNATRHRYDANPFTYYERVRLLRAGLDWLPAGQQVEIVPFPLHSPQLWAGYVPLHAVQWVRVFSEWEDDKARRLAAGGYAVEVLRPARDKLVSATQVRELLAAGDPRWRDAMPAAVADLVDEFLSSWPLAARAADRVAGA